ncbi:EpsG family protein [Leuconostoc gasicomitatum]|uniref:EpsG family protein n=1 Tax=Leuconostoc gasicomitatum TaxID=115778 RepID=UPI001CC665D7|nr:EpsG family protein [Leuconostoc gasicomitatum]MBZ5987865.1 EpsG family protein [Leuconostoc gasicomitatum]MBZ5989307.1 EpsG family protein [Leuconostoc gasicomitatum]
MIEILKKKARLGVIIFLYFLLFVIVVKRSVLNINSRSQIIDFIIVLVIILYSILKIYFNQDAGNWGTDQYTYYYHFFLPLRDITWSEFISTNFTQKEFGFKLVLWIIINVKVLTFLQFQIVMFLLELIPIFIISRFINHNKEIDIILFTFIVYPFFANGATNVLRQGLALGLLMIAYLWSLKNSNEKGIFKQFTMLFIVVASFFHQTALMLALMWLFIIFTRKRIKLHCFWIISIIFGFLDITNINQRLFGSIGSMFSDNYDLYIDPTAQANYGLGSKYSFVFISFLLAVILNYLFKQVKYEEKEKAELLLKQYLGSVSAFFAFSFIAFADRIGMYAWTVAPMIAFYFIDKMDESKPRRFFLVMIPIFCLLIGYGMSSGSYFVNR